MTSYALVSIDGLDQTTDDDDDIEHVHVSLPGEGGGTPDAYCMHCSAEVAEYYDPYVLNGNQWKHLENDEEWCADEGECANCEEEIVLDVNPASRSQTYTWREDPAVWGDARDFRCGLSEDHRHEPRGVRRAEPRHEPHAWANSASVTFDDDHDAISVAISVGDPRGALVMTVERVMRCQTCALPEASHVRQDDGHDYVPTSHFTLHVPYDNEPLPHVPLTKIGPGTYRIGVQE